VPKRPKILGKNFPFQFLNDISLTFQQCIKSSLFRTVCRENFVSARLPFSFFLSIKQRSCFIGTPVSKENGGGWKRYFREKTAVFYENSDGGCS